MIEGQLIDRYHIGTVIHEGEFTSVYRATHQLLGSVHAVKVQNVEVPPEIPESLLHEGRLQSLVHHRNVLTVDDGFVLERRVVLVMKLVRGECLADLLDRRPLSLRAALGIFRGVTRGVRAMHVHNIVHRDIKPENILLAKEEGRIIAKISDFGLAKLLEPGKDPEAHGLSRAFRYLGTPEYMAPEQAQNPAGVDTRADMFSLGCLLYELVTNRVCFDAEKPIDAMYKAAKSVYEPLQSLAPEAPVGLSEIVNELLQPRVMNRLASCDLLLQRLDKVRV